MKAKWRPAAKATPSTQKLQILGYRGPPLIQKRLIHYMENTENTMTRAPRSQQHGVSASAHNSTEDLQDHNSMEDFHKHLPHTSSVWLSPVSKLAQQHHTSLSNHNSTECLPDHNSKEDLTKQVTNGQKHVCFGWEAKTNWGFCSRGLWRHALRICCSL